MHRAVFLDRDGVICQNRRDYVKSWDEFVFLPGGLKVLARLALSDLLVVVITNQSMINRGIAPLTALEDIHTRMLQAVESAGGRIDLIKYCPHRPDEHCNCRKPRPGMLLEAAEELGIDLANSYLVGDAETDMQVARAAGCRRYLVLTGLGREQLARCWHHMGKDFGVVPDLRAALDAILRRENGNGLG